MAGRPEPALKELPVPPLFKICILLCCITSILHIRMRSACTCTSVNTFFSSSPREVTEQVLPTPQRAPAPSVHMQSGRLALRSSRSEDNGETTGKSGQRAVKDTHSAPPWPRTTKPCRPCRPARQPPECHGRTRGAAPRLGRPEDEPLSVVKRIASAAAQRP